MKKLLRRLKAFFLGTFVADCPVCHKHFYGHQTYLTSVMVKGKPYRIICPACAKQHLLA